MIQLAQDPFFNPYTKCKATPVTDQSLYFHIRTLWPKNHSPHSHLTFQIGQIQNVKLLFMKESEFTDTAIFPTTENNIA